jgi:hypothetical protein
MRDLLHASRETLEYITLRRCHMPMIVPDDLVFPRLQMLTMEDIFLDGARDDSFAPLSPTYLEFLSLIAHSDAYKCKFTPSKTRYLAENPTNTEYLMQLWSKCIDIRAELVEMEFLDLNMRKIFEATLAKATWSKCVVFI